MDDEQVKSLPLGRLIVFGLAIAFVLIILFQNLQPLVVLYFLGRFTIPIPLSFAVLGAFISGAITAFVFNLISFWLRRRRDRVFADIYEYDDELLEDEEVVDKVDKKESPKTKQSPPKQAAQDEDFEEDEDTYEYGTPKKQSKYPDEYEDDYREVIDVKYIDRK